MSMVERVARALKAVEMERAGIVEEAEMRIDMEWPLVVQDARAALLAMREPTEEMLEWLRDTGAVGLAERWKGKDIWQAMIDAALKE